MRQLAAISSKVEPEGFIVASDAAVTVEFPQVARDPYSAEPISGS